MAYSLNRIRVALRCMVYTATMNTENMQGTGFHWLVKNTARDLGVKLTPEKLSEQRDYFTTNPSMISFLLGVFFKELGKGADALYKRSYASAFAALGDSFFWHGLKPLAFLFAAIGSIHHPVLGIFAYFFVYNLFHLGFLLLGFDIGRDMGRDVITWFQRVRFRQWPAYVDFGTAFLCGFFIIGLMKHEDGSLPWFPLYALASLGVGFLCAKRIRILHGVALFFVLLMVAGLARGL